MPFRPFTSVSVEFPVMNDHLFGNHLVTSNNVIDDVELFFNVKEALNVLVANQLATGLNIQSPFVLGR
jgi:hypothetical protein